MMDPEKEADELLKRLSVAEALLESQKLNHDMEAKKEELRQLVGERYRQLITAADTITSMKNASHEVVSSLANIKELCLPATPGLTSSSSILPLPRQTSLQFANHATAAQMKLLVNTPEHVWAALESRGHLRAARLYLLAQHVFDRLKVEHYQNGTAPAELLLTAFPVLARQWTAISHFRESILSSARTEMADSNCTSDELVEALTAILLLDVQNQKSIMQRFLSARSRALLFSSTSFLDSNNSQNSTTSPTPTVRVTATDSGSVQSRVCAMVLAVEATIRHIHSVFLPSVTAANQAALLSKLTATLQSVADVPSLRGVADEDCVSSLFTSRASMHSVVRNLPTVVLHYKPLCGAAAEPLAGSVVQDLCKQWLKQTVAELCPAITTMLGFVRTLQGLRLLVDSVWEKLGTVNIGESVEWETVTRETLGESVCLWKLLLKSCIQARAQEILQSQLHQSVVSAFDKSLQDCVEALNHNELEVEHNPGRMDWEEDNTHSPADKAIGISPKSREILDAVERQICAGYQDLEHLISTHVVDQTSADTAFRRSISSVVASARSVIASTHQMTGPFDRFEDAAELIPFARLQVLACLSDLAATASRMFPQMHSNNSARHASHSSTNGVVDRDYSNATPNVETLESSTALLIARICLTLRDHSHKLTSAVLKHHTSSRPSSTTPTTAISSEAAARARLSVSRRSNHLLSLNTEDPELAARLEALGAVATAAHAYWTQTISTAVEKSFKMFLSSSKYDLGFGAWQEIAISEEDEQGKSSSTTIKVPCLLSSAVSAIIYDLCRILNWNSCRVLPREIMYTLIASIGDAVVRVYAELPIPVNQDACLQWMFDQMVLQHLLAGRSSSLAEINAFQRAVMVNVDRCGQNVDPFDRTLFEPNMKLNAIRCFHRHFVLYGPLCKYVPPRGVPAQAPARNNASDNFNALDLAPSPQRFALLAVSERVLENNGRPQVPWTTKTSVGDVQAIYSL